MNEYEIRDDDIRHNIEAVQARAGVPVWGVLKYDGYGVGLMHMARLLTSGGIRRFAVCDAAEARKLREAGFTDEDILLLSPQGSDEEIISGLDDGVIFSVGSTEYADRLARLAGAREAKIRAHIAVDTGMGRFGFLPEKYDDIRALYGRSDFCIEGIYSHFAAASSEKNYTRRQFQRFSSLLSSLRQDGIDRGMAHIANSPGLFCFDGMQLDAVRTGSALLGRIAGISCGETGLRRVGVLAATVCEVKELPAGSRSGYGGEARLFKNTKLAVLSAGRRQGIPTLRMRKRIMRRFLQVRINGCEAKLIVSDSESHAAADVSGLSVAPGDIAYIDINPLRLSGDVRRRYI